MTITTWPLWKQLIPIIYIKVMEVDPLYLIREYLYKVILPYVPSSHCNNLTTGPGLSRVPKTEHKCGMCRASPYIVMDIVVGETW